MRRREGEGKGGGMRGGEGVRGGEGKGGRVKVCVRECV